VKKDVSTLKGTEKGATSSSGSATNRIIIKIYDQRNPKLKVSHPRGRKGSVALAKRNSPPGEKMALRREKTVGPHVEKTR